MALIRMIGHSQPPVCGFRIAPKLAAREFGQIEQQKYIGAYIRCGMPFAIPPEFKPLKRLGGFDSFFCNGGGI